MRIYSRTFKYRLLLKLDMQQRGPWIVKKVISKYKNRWMEVHEHQVIRPDGKDGIYGIVKIISGSSILPIDEQGYVYLVKEYRFALGSESIELPGGAIDNQEDSLTTAKRELKEELGITAQQWIALGKVNHLTSIVQSVSYLFLATNLTFSTAQLEATEQIQMIRVPFREAVQMIVDGKISHSASCLLILKAERYLRDNPDLIKNIKWSS